MKMAPGKKNWACLPGRVAATTFKEGVVRKGVTAKGTLKLISIEVQDLILS